MVLPLKMSIIKALKENSNSSIENIMDNLREKYGSEKQFNEKTFFHAFQALQAVGYISRASVFLDKKGNPEGKYVITEAGLNSIKMIPNK